MNDEMKIGDENQEARAKKKEPRAKMQDARCKNQDARIQIILISVQYRQALVSFKFIHNPFKSVSNLTAKYIQLWIIQITH